MLFTIHLTVLKLHKNQIMMQQQHIMKEKIQAIKRIDVM